MIITFTIQGNENDLPKIQSAMGILGEGVVTVQKSLKRANGAAEPEPLETDEPVEAKRRGRPRRGMKTEAEEPVPEEQAPEAQAIIEEQEITDKFMLEEVGAFCKKYPKLQPAVSNLCHEFGVERISHIPQGQRGEFLSQLQTLPTLS